MKYRFCNQFLLIVALLSMGGMLFPVSSVLAADPDCDDFATAALRNTEIVIKGKIKIPPGEVKADLGNGICKLIFWEKSSVLREIKNSLTLQTSDTEYGEGLVGEDPAGFDNDGVPIYRHTYLRIFLRQDSPVQEISCHMYYPNRSAAKKYPILLYDLFKEGALTGKLNIKNFEPNSCKKTRVLDSPMHNEVEKTSTPLGRPVMTLLNSPDQVGEKTQIVLAQADAQSSVYNSADTKTVSTPVALPSGMLDSNGTSAK